MRRWIRELLWVLVGLAPSVLFAAEAKPVVYAERNIDWGEVAVSEVVRTRRSTMGVGGPAATVESRVLTLASGSKLQIWERIVQEAAGEARIFESGHQLSEITVVADEARLADVLEALRRAGYPIRKRYGLTGRILRVAVPQDDRAEVQALLSELGTLGETQAAYSAVNFYLPAGRRSAESGTVRSGVTLTSEAPSVRAQTFSVPQASAPAPVPNDPKYPQQWGLKRVGVPQVWAQGFFGYPNILCAVYDTGVRMTHEDLRVNVRTRVSALNSDPRPDDHHGHGSHCLGIMGADGNNGKGISGVGQVANLTSIRGPISYWKEGDNILDGYQYALEHGIKVLSCSFGTPPGSGTDDSGSKAMIDELGRAGTLVVIAAGNDANDNDRLPTFPSSHDCDNILSVVATGLSQDEQTDVLADFSSYGATTCDIGAPGVKILSCTNAGDTAYEAWDGTSMATPLVAACAAMLWERNPSWTYADVKRRLMATAAPCGELLGRCQTGGRVDLVRALDASAGYLSVTPFAETAIEAGTAISLEVTAERAAQVSVTLMHRDGTPVEGTTFEPKVFAYPAGAPSVTFDVWTPTESDKGRGYVFKTVALDASGQPLPEVFAYSSLFRVKSAVTAETIEVTAPSTGDLPVDANWMTFSLKPSDAVMADVALESRRRGAPDGDPWTLEATLGRVTVTPGAWNLQHVQLKGKGWISETLEYRISVSDTDDMHIVGTSAPFAIGRSSCSVYLMPGDPKYPDDPVGTLGHCTGSWQKTYRAGEPFRLTGWLPESSMYWFALVDCDSGQVLRLTDYWADATQYRRSLRRFEFAFPDAYAMKGKRWRLALIDIFSGGMLDATPPDGFEILPRVNSAGTAFELKLYEAAGDALAHEYRTDGRWRAERRERDGLSDERWMRCGWIGPGERASFETVVSGPAQTVSFLALWDADRPADTSFSLQYAGTPVLNESQWADLTRNEQASAQQGRAVYDIPAGTWAVRWVCSRAADARVAEGKEGPLMTLSQVVFGARAQNVSLHIGGDGTASVGNCPPSPGYVTYTLDGSEPTASGTRWPAGQSLRFPGSVVLKAKGFAPKATPGDTATAVRFAPRAGGSGTQFDPYLISEPVDLTAFAESVNAGRSFAGEYLQMTGDIDMTGVRVSTAGWERSLAAEGGDARDLPFSGVFDGDGYRIVRPVFIPFAPPFWMNGSLIEPQDRLGGFIGLMRGGVLRNLTLYHPVAEATAPGSYGAMAALVAYVEQGAVIENCHVIAGTVDSHGMSGNGGVGFIPLGGICAYVSEDGQTPRPQGCTGELTVDGRPVSENYPDVEQRPAEVPEGADAPSPAAPRLSPVPGPFFEDITVRLLPGEDGGTVQYSDTGRLEEFFTLTVDRFPIAAGSNRTFWVRTKVGDAVSVPVRAEYLWHVRPQLPPPLMLNAGGAVLQNNVQMPPLSEQCVLKMSGLPEAYPMPEIRYTLAFVNSEKEAADVPEPTEQSPLYTGPIPIPGTCVIRARAFAPPYYRPSASVTRFLPIIRHEDFRAPLTVVDGAVTNGAWCQSELFEVTAAEPPQGQIFSHWQVTGPLVLEQPRSNPVTFRYLTKAPVTLKAVFLKKRPGFRWQLR